jgi:hypothetical protein
MVLGVTSHAGAQLAGVDFIGDTGTALADAETIGWSFSISQPITITALGTFGGTAGGAGGTVQGITPVSLWTQSGTLLDSTIVGPGTAGSLFVPPGGQGAWYEPVTPTVLTPGTYIIGAQYQENWTLTLVDPFDQGATFSPQITFEGTQSIPGAGFPAGNSGRVSLVGAAQGYWGPNFLYAVPEPSSCVILFAATFVGLNRRSRLAR